MNRYYVVQHFSGNLVRRIQANNRQEAREKFLNQTLGTSQEIEKLAGESSKWHDIDIFLEEHGAEES